MHGIILVFLDHVDVDEVNDDFLVERGGHMEVEGNVLVGLIVQKED